MSALDLPETRYARLGDITLAYQTMGSGAHDLIIIPGIISHVEFAHELPGYTAFLRRLSTFARVVTFDKRGQGLSDRVSHVPTLEERMDDVRAIMDALGTRRAALLGFSEGSPMSVLFATTHPERTSHLILLGGFPRGGYNVSDEAFDAHAEKVIANWGTGQMMKRVVGAPGENEREMALLGKFERLASSPGAYKTLMLMNQKIDVSSILPNVRAPTLVLHSLADVVVPVSEGRKFAAAIPHAKLIEYDDLPHGVWARNCDPLIGDVEEFITGRREAAAEDADRVLAPAGFYAPDPDKLARLRAGAARAPKAFKAMTARLKKAGLNLSAEDSLKRAARGFEAIQDPEIAAAARLKSMICLRPVPEAAIASPALADDFCAFAADALPLLKWGWDALADSR